MKKVYLSLLLCLLYAAGHAQSASSYIFSRTTGTYSSISGTGSVFSSSNCDDCTNGGIPIGFTFNFCGTNYTSLSASSNGWISLSSNTSCCQYPAYTTAIVGAGFLFPFWQDCHGGYGGSNIYYSTTGSAGSKIFTIEYNNWDRYGNSGADMNVQVKLYEGSNKIEYWYGTNTYGSADLGIGISNSASDYQNLPSAASTTCGATLPSGCCTGGGCGLPANGSVLQWVLCVNPPASTGTMSMCVGGTTTLSNSVTIGTWSSNASGVASVVSGTGVVTGVSAGTARISYIVPGGCQSNVVVTVNAKPTVASITPSATTVCIGSPVTFTAGTVSGTGSLTSYNWSGPSSFSTTSAVNNTSITTSSTAQAGSYNVTVTYAGSGCTSNPVSSAAVVINTAPPSIGGTTAVCEGASGTLTNATSGGTWTSATPSVASVNPSTGVISGASGGSAVITYTLPNSCYTTTIASVNPLPVVTVTPPGPTTICMGSNTSFTASSPNPLFALLSQDFESGLGSWVVSGPAAPANRWQIVTPGSSAASIPGDGSNMLQTNAQSTITNSIVLHLLSLHSDTVPQH